MNRITANPCLVPVCGRALLSKAKPYDLPSLLVHQHSVDLLTCTRFKADELPLCRIKPAPRALHELLLRVYHSLLELNKESEDYGHVATLVAVALITGS